MCFKAFQTKNSINDTPEQAELLLLKQTFPEFWDYAVLNRNYCIWDIKL